MQEKNEGELLSKTGPGLDNLGNSQPVQTAKNIKSRRFTVRNVYSGQKTNIVAVPLLLILLKDEKVRV